MTIEQIDQLTKTLFELADKAVPSRSPHNRLYFSALIWTAELGREKQRQEALERLLDGICHLSYKHEVQYWKDAPGTDSAKLDDVLKLARDALGLVRGKLRPDDVLDVLPAPGNAACPA